VTVQNITLQNWDYEIKADGTGNTNVIIKDNNLLENSTFGVNLNLAEGITIFENNISGSSNAGVYFKRSNDSNVSYNNITSGPITTPLNGIYMDEAENNTIASNNFSIQEYAMKLGSSNNNVFDSNTITSSFESGFELAGSDSNVFRYNVISYPTSSAFYLIGADNNTIFKNSINHSNLHGFNLSFSNNNNISYNNLTNVSEVGFTLSEVTNGTFSFNIATNVSGGGFDLDRVVGANISNNTIKNDATYDFGGVIGFKLFYTNNSIVANNSLVNLTSSMIILNYSNGNTFVSNNYSTASITNLPVIYLRGDNNSLSDFYFSSTNMSSATSVCRPVIDVKNSNRNNISNFVLVQPTSVAIGGLYLNRSNNNTMSNLYVLTSCTSFHIDNSSDNLIKNSNSSCWAISDNVTTLYAFWSGNNSFNTTLSNFRFNFTGNFSTTTVNVSANGEDFSFRGTQYPRDALENISKFFNISDTKSIAGPPRLIFFDVGYTHEDLGNVLENSLLMKYYAGGSNPWAAFVMTGVDTANNFVWAQIFSNDLSSTDKYVAILGTFNTAPKV